MRRLPLLFLLLCSALFPSLTAQAATTYYVALSGNDTNPGTSAAPFVTIQKALNTAATGDTVQVGDGTYVGTGNRDLSFNGKGINLRSANGAGSTIIECGGTQTDNHRAFNITTNEPSGTTIDGFTMQHGFCSGSTFSDSGAIFLVNSNATIRNCIFRENRSVAANGIVYGGALEILSTETHSVSVTNCLFTGNTSSSTSSVAGGAIYSQWTGTGSLSVNIQNCTITGNTATGPASGLAIFNYGSTMNVTNSIIYGDTASSGQSEISGTNSPNVTYSDIQGSYSGEGNIDADPLFISSTNFQLQKYSPAVNTGTNANAPSEDLLRVARPQGGKVDMGAYEYVGFTESLVVTTLDDENNGTSDTEIGRGTSLREALFYALGHAGADTITFAPYLGGTIDVKTSLPAADRGLSILGPTTKSIVIHRNSDAAFRFFTLLDQDNLTLQNLTFTNGSSDNSDGGAIRNEGILTISNCTFMGNSAAYDGGAIYSRYGTLNISNSTLTNNSAQVNGGGISSVNDTATITNCTITGNTDSGGAGGISSYGSATTSTKVSNSIVANNNTSSTSGDVGFSGDSNTNSFTSLGYNLIGTGNAIPTFNQTGDKTGVTLDQLKLGFFGNNGGPTPTVALQEGSIAINAGNTDLTTDQRGTARPQSGVDDIGAFEFSPTKDTLVVTTLADENDYTNDSSVGTGRSLREAINTANSRGGGVITFAPNLAGTITVGDTLPTFSKSMEIQGPTNASIAISGDNAHSIIRTVNEVMKISNLTFRNGYNAYSGGAMFVEGPLTVENCTFVSNTAAIGGAICVNSYLGSSLVTLRNCTFSGNSATRGGAIANSYGTLDVQNCTITSNSASGQGGGISSYEDDDINITLSTTVSNSIVAGNTGGDVDLLDTPINSFQSLGYNLIGQGSGTSAFNKSGDKIIGAAAPGLAAYANNGGPTLTRALLPTSPAVNAGDPSFDGSGKTDQRGPGFARVKFGRLDIGAVESDIDSPPVPTILTPTNNQSLATIAFKSITGTASDNLGVTQVQLKLFRTRNGVSTFWNGSAFTSTQTLLNATISAPGTTSTNWNYTISPALTAALDAGTYSIAVYAKDTAGTTSAAVGRNFTLFVDTTAPTPVIVTPANNQVLSPTGFTAITGTATDNSGVTQVQVKLFRTRNGVSTFWNGSAFTSTQTLLDATLALPGAASTTWSYAVTLALRSALDNGAYSIVAYAKDASGNTSAAVGRNFSIDSVIPAAVVLSPTQNQNLPIQSFSSITGTATDNTAVAQVQIKLFRTRGGVTQFWNGSAFVTTDTRLNTTLSTSNAASTNWTYSISSALRAALDSGAYSLVAYAIDTAGNQSPAAGRNFTLYSDTSAPTVAFTTPNQNQPLAASAFTSIAGTATDDIGVTGVTFKLFRSRNGVIEYWNGSAFTTTAVLLTATISNPGATSTGWNYVVPAALRNSLDVGTYNLVAYAKDAAGNQSAGVGRTFSITSTSGALTTPPTSVSRQEF